MKYVVDSNKFYTLIKHFTLYNNDGESIKKRKQPLVIFKYIDEKQLKNMTNEALKKYIGHVNVCYKENDFKELSRYNFDDIYLGCADDIIELWFPACDGVCPEDADCEIHEAFAKSTKLVEGTLKDSDLYYYQSSEDD